MPHSALALKLRMGVIESELDLQIRLSYMQSYAAMHAHPNADISAAFGEFKLIFGDARSSIPYMTAGKGGAEQVTDERMDFVRAYQEMRASEQAGYKPREAGLKPVSLGRKRDK